MIKTVFFALFLAIAACRPSPSEPIKITDELPSSFLSFYERFHADSAFQMAHIVFPLEGRPAEYTEGQDPEQFRWIPETWTLHRPFDDMGGTFDRAFINIDDIIVEKIKGGNGQFEMERRFTRIQNQWQLIYYAALHQR